MNTGRVRSRSAFARLANARALPPNKSFEWTGLERRGIITLIAARRSTLR